jgi:hypothetical protein
VLVQVWNNQKDQKKIKKKIKDTDFVNLVQVWNNQKDQKKIKKKIKDTDFVKGE